MIAKLLSLKRYPEFARLLWWRTVTAYDARRRGLRFGTGTTFFGAPIITVADGSTIALEERVTLCSVSAYTALGVNHPVVLRTLRRGAEIHIGSDSGISGATICAAARVHIGNHCLIGANVIITDTDFHAVSPVNRRYNSNEECIGARPVHVADNVFLGTGAIILKGVSIGQNSIVGAGAVVTADVPPNAIVAGNPAKLIRHI